MYFPTSAARQISTVPALPNLKPEPVIALCPSPSKSLFCTLARSGLAVWKARACLLIKSDVHSELILYCCHLQPTVTLAYLSRTTTSLLEHGDNTAAHWAPDGSRIIIQVLFNLQIASSRLDYTQTGGSYLVLVSVRYDGRTSSQSYECPPLPSTAQPHFQAGPGEGLPIFKVNLSFEGVIRVDGELLRYAELTCRMPHAILIFSFRFAVEVYLLDDNT